MKSVQELKAEVDALKAENVAFQAKEVEYAKLAAQVKELQQMIGVNIKKSGVKTAMR